MKTTTPLHKHTVTKDAALRRCLEFIKDERAAASSIPRLNDLHDIASEITEALANPYALVPDAWRKHTLDLERLLALLQQSTASVRHDPDHDGLILSWQDESTEFAIYRNCLTFSHVEEGLLPDEEIITELLAYDVWETSRICGVDVLKIAHAPWATVVSQLGRRILELIHADAMDAINPTSEIVTPSHP